MTKKEQQEVSVKLYYEDTLDTQNTFRNRLEFLINNKTILPASQRNSFFIALSKSTLEVGRGQQVYYIAKNGIKIKLGTFYNFAQRMTYQTKPIIKMQYPPVVGKMYEIPIENLWRVVLNHFLKVRPYALEEARRLSSERIRLQDKPGVVEWKPGD